MRAALRAPFLLAAALPLAAAQPAPVKQSRPKLVLTIVVDQFRYDYLTRFREHYKGGLARLLDRGAVFTNAHYEHFPTVTAVGHAAILTGATPSVNGIVGNEWFDRASGKQVTSVSDDNTQLLGVSGKRGSSPHRLLVSTVGDELKMCGGGASKVIGMSIKDRSAILPAGRMADGAYWFDEASGNFVSSTWYFPALPAWVEEFNRQRFPDQYAGVEWKSVLDGKLFLKMPASASGSYRQLQRSPYGNELLELFAERAVQAESLGKRGHTDLLSVSFSSNDYVGHDYGPHSDEVRDISIRTDQVLDRLFAFLDKEIGMANVLVAFTADHGVAPMPEFMQKNRMPGGRMKEAAVLGKVEEALSARFGPGNWISGKSGPAPYFNYDLIRERKLDLAEVQNVAAAAAQSMPQIFRVYTRDQLSKGRVLQDYIDRRVQNGFHTDRAADLFIVAQPYWLFEDKGTSHATPFNYDSHVPVIFHGPGVKAGRYERRTAINDIAVTMAAMLGVTLPSGASGRALDEMMAAPPARTGHGAK